MAWFGFLCSVSFVRRIAISSFNIYICVCIKTAANFLVFRPFAYLIACIYFFVGSFVRLLSSSSDCYLVIQTMWCALNQPLPSWYFAVLLVWWHVFAPLLALLFVCYLSVVHFTIVYQFTVSIVLPPSCLFLWSFNCSINRWVACWAIVRLFVRPHFVFCFIFAACLSFTYPSASPILCLDLVHASWRLLVLVLSLAIAMCYLLCQKFWLSFLSWTVAFSVCLS